MPNPDESLKKLKKIYSDFSTFCGNRGRVSEADTRVKIIDRVLKEVLEWQEDSIDRETHVAAGFIDYRLSLAGGPVLAVEAKAEGVSFQLPEDSGRRRLSLSGTLKTSKDVWAAIDQVRAYCVSDVPIRFAIATNGYSWIIFEALPTKKSWREGNAVVFYSPKDIETNFVEFWGLLSRISTEKSGSLPREFDGGFEPRKQYRVLEGLFDKDIPLARNRLHAQVSPIIEAFLGDIAEQDEREILESCYVPSGTVHDAALGLKQAIEIDVPRLLREQGAKVVKIGKEDSGEFDAELASAIKKPDFHLYLLLGGIGAGKSTFIKRYIKVTGAAALKEKALCFYIDLLAAPINDATLELDWYKLILQDVRKRYSEVVKESKKTHKEIYKGEMDLLFETRLKDEGLDSQQCEKEFSKEFDRLMADTADYTRRLLKLCKSRGKTIVIFIDNVDQLAPEYQTNVFLLAQKLTREIGAVTVLALREESYYTANSQRTLTAYTNKKFMIGAPRFRELIHKRLEHAMKVLLRSDDEIKLMLRSGIKLEKKEIIDFLKILEESIFVRSKNIARFIEAICGGNMRLALDTFSTFLVSGTTDVDKMLAIYRRDGSYQVAFHEYVKSIMLMDRFYYKETAENPIMNIFDCGTEKNSSHFTALRLIRMLEQHETEYSPEGRGYIELQRVISAFERAFDNVDDLARTADRLVRWKLVEVNSKSTATVKGASHIRITTAGRFYHAFLAKDFVYLDLVLQDTPMDDWIAHKQLVELVKQVNNLTGKESEKRERLAVRFNRVDVFLEYLRKQEKTEIEALEARGTGPEFRHKFLDLIDKEFAIRRQYIEKRLEELKTSKSGVVEEDKVEVPELFDAAVFDPGSIKP